MVHLQKMLKGRVWSFANHPGGGGVAVGIEKAILPFGGQKWPKINTSKPKGGMAKEHTFPPFLDPFPQKGSTRPLVWIWIILIVCGLEVFDMPNPYRYAMVSISIFSRKYDINIKNDQLTISLSMIPKCSTL